MNLDSPRQRFTVENSYLLFYIVLVITQVKLHTIKTVKSLGNTSSLEKTFLINPFCQIYKVLVFVDNDLQLLSCFSVMSKPCPENIKLRWLKTFFLQIHRIYGSLHRYTRRGRNILRQHFLLIVLTLKSNEEVTICFYRVFSRVYTMIPAQLG